MVLVETVTVCAVAVVAGAWVCRTCSIVVVDPTAVAVWAVVAWAEVSRTVASFTGSTSTEAFDDLVLLFESLVACFGSFDLGGMLNVQLCGVQARQLL